MTNQSIPRPLYVRHPDYVGEVPFQNDLFNRQALANTLTGYIDRIKDGCVIGLDAPWGEGKSWFGRNWQAKLDAEGYKTIYVDAFEQDYSEDPFTVLVAEILTTLASDKDQPLAKSLWGASAKLGKTLLPTAAKITINTLGRIVLGTSELSSDLAEAAQRLDDKVAEAAEKYIASRLAESDAEKRSVAGFRKALADFAAAQPKPVVFFIDELDRCRPDFSVRVVERVKHFFDVPNLIFVLLLNRGQLCRAIEGVYGRGFDANDYLGKFVHLFLALPKKKSIEYLGSNATSVYAFHVARRYNFPNSNELENFIHAFGQLSAAFDMSLRDVEKAFILVGLAGVSESISYFAWPIVLKLKYPDVFRGLLAGDRNSHKEAITLLQSIDSADTHFWIRDYFLAVHSEKVLGRDGLSDDLKRYLDDYAPRSYFRGEVLAVTLRRLDVALMD